MNTTLLILTALLAVVICVFVLLWLTQPPKQSRRQQRRFGVRKFSRLERMLLPCVLAMSVLATRCQQFFSGGNRIALANAILTHPECGDTALADEAIGRFKIIKAGTDQYHKALCDKNDIPEGFTRDSSASGAEERFAFDYLGLARKGTEATASGQCDAGHLCCPGDDGTVRDITQVANETVYVCGKLITSAATGLQVAFVPYPPTKLVIA